MNTQNTLDKQTATFIAALAQNVPSLSIEQMQFFIENPIELQRKLTCLQPTMREFVKRIGLVRHIEFVQLRPNWDLLIMRSNHYPEVGIVVSDRDGTLGQGLKLAIVGKKESENFRAPCGCCNWFGQFSGSRESEESEKVSAVKAVRDACAEKGIKILLFHCWHNAMEQGVDGLKLIDPYQDSTQELDKDLFHLAFGWLRLQTKDGVIAISTLF